jgi:hypothetical protein
MSVRCNCLLQPCGEVHLTTFRTKCRRFHLCLLSFPKEGRVSFSRIKFQQLFQIVFRFYGTVTFDSTLLFNINIVLMCCHIRISKRHSENPFSWIVFFSVNIYPNNAFSGTIVFAETKMINCIPGFLTGIAFRWPCITAHEWTGTGCFELQSTRPDFSVI